MVITVVGTGYVGLSIAVLLSRHHEVRAVDIAPERVQLVNQRRSPIEDSLIEAYLQKEALTLEAMLPKEEAYLGSEYVILAVPTDYDSETDAFDTRAVENAYETVRRYNRQAAIVIKSTVPVGYTRSLQQRYNDKNIFFSPEFLQESRALYDNLYPSRIVVGTNKEDGAACALAEGFASLLQGAALKKDVPVCIMDSREAEAVKLFSNTYLAMRVGFFNELDGFCELKGLNTASIIEGMCLDPRIGGHYNNPSFGYGGYCLPKDSRQLLSHFSGVPQSLIGAVVESNGIRKEHIARRVLALVGFPARQDAVIGVYRLVMKTGSDNFRHSAILGVMERLQQAGAKLMVYEPNLEGDVYMGYPVERDLSRFKGACDLILANRFDPLLEDVSHKLYTRDLFGRD